MIFGKYINKYYRKYWYYFALIIVIDAIIDVVQLFIPKIIGGIITILNMISKSNTFTQEDYMSGVIEGYYDEYNNYVKNLFFTRNFQTT